MSDLKLEIKRLIIESLNLEDLTPDDIDDDAPLFGDGELALDSIDALELAMAVQRRFGVRIVDSKETRRVMASVSALAAYIESR
jgi:acyl carrier protein